MSIVVTTLDTESGESQTVTLKPGQFVVCCAEPAHVVSDVAYASGKNQVWVKRHRTEAVKNFIRPRGTCQVCGQDRSLNAAGGVVYAHDNPRKPGEEGWPGRCPGSRRPPRGDS